MPEDPEDAAFRTLRVRDSAHYRIDNEAARRRVTMFAVVDDALTAYDWLKEHGAIANGKTFVIPPSLGVAGQTSPVGAADLPKLTDEEYTCVAMCLDILRSKDHHIADPEDSAEAIEGLKISLRAYCRVIDRDPDSDRYIRGSKSKPDSSGPQSSVGASSERHARTTSRGKASRKG